MSKQDFFRIPLVEYLVITHPGMTMSALRVYIAMRSIASRDRPAIWASDQTIAGRAGLKERTVKDGIARLREMQLITTNNPNPFRSTHRLCRISESKLEEFGRLLAGWKRHGDLRLENPLAKVPGTPSSTPTVVKTYRFAGAMAELACIDNVKAASRGHTFEEVCERANYEVKRVPHVLKAYELASGVMADYSVAVDMVALMLIRKCQSDPSGATVSGDDMRAWMGIDPDLDWDLL